MTDTPAALVDAREQFLAMVQDVRPELHRYCARLTGSVIEGEDIVQEALAKAFYALSLMPEVPPLRPWLFRIAHNAALDFLKSHGRKYVDVTANIEELAGYEDSADPAIVRAALARFLVLPNRSQYPRSAFYDSNYHLRESWQHRHSVLLAEKLRPLLSP